VRGGFVFLESAFCINDFRVIIACCGTGAEKERFYPFDVNILYSLTTVLNES
jgi:hypothetical protein